MTMNDEGGTRGGEYEFSKQRASLLLDELLNIAMSLPCVIIVLRQ